MTRSPLAACALIAACSNTPPASPTDAGTRPTDAVTPPADGAQACNSANVQTGPGLVRTDLGVVRGVRAGNAWSFKGVPYAAPPVGELRWKPPAPAACWTGVREAMSFGAMCPQLDASDNIVGEEDCLTLNVWTPANATPDQTFPVLFFIHGGGNTQGSSAIRTVDGTYLYDGAQLAERGPAVVVTINYRLGALGFFAHAGLRANGGAQSGNFGLLDQVAALQWARRNVRAFGGDPARMLVFGESAGAVDTCALVASPMAAGLFSRALMQSGACTATALSVEEATGVTRVMGTSCATAPDPIACLRAMPAREVVRAMPGDVDVARGSANGYKLVIDGTSLPAPPLETIRTGRHNRVAFVVGSNTDETSRSVPAMLTVAQYEAIVRMTLGPVLGQRALDQYPVSMYGTPRLAYIALTSDARFVCQARKAARAVRGAQTEPVRRYVFGQRLTGMASVLGAWHGLELPFLFGALGVSGYQPTPGDLALSAAMQRYWVRFAATGDPNGTDDVAWPAYVSATDDHLFLGTPTAAGTNVRAPQCDFWDSIVP